MFSDLKIQPEVLRTKAFNKGVAVDSLPVFFNYDEF